jgi:hypothetical protein
VVLSTATFDDVVRVSDPERTQQRLLGGAGSANGYGYGLITPAPMVSATAETAPSPSERAMEFALYSVGRPIQAAPFGHHDRADERRPFMPRLARRYWLRG